MITLIEFFARAMPDSSSAKPACMKNTSAPAAAIHTTSAASCVAYAGGAIRGVRGTGDE